jgi:protein TonB
MIASYPALVTPAKPVRRVERTSMPAPATSVAGGSWRYDSRPRSRTIVVVAALVSAGLHAGLLLGFGHAKTKTIPPKAEHVIALRLAIPEIKDLEEPEPVPNEDAGRSDESFLPVPMQADLPQLPKPNDFVQQIDFSSLIERPDFSQAKLFTIPENIRRESGKIAESIGTIFNLADLDRIPEPVFQPAPVYPMSMKREGVTATVVVEFIVDTQGRAVNAMVTDSTHRSFEQAAVMGVQKWKFRAGVRGGRKVNTRMRVPIVFTIEETID